MNFARVVSEYVVMELGDSDKSEHKYILSNIEAHLSKGFRCFVFDIHQVKKMNSTILSLIIGLTKAILREKCRMFLLGLDPIKRDLLNLSLQGAITIENHGEVLLGEVVIEELMMKNTELLSVR